PRLLVLAPPEIALEFAKVYAEDLHFKRYLAPARGNGPPQYSQGADGLLYFRDADSRLRLCIPSAKRMLVLVQVHNSPWEGAHAG
ncbi:hypothetical protein CALVIDRAFT_462690, partial [Calocera viscosa TUFC12733]